MGSVARRTRYNGRRLVPTGENERRERLQPCFQYHRPVDLREIRLPGAKPRLEKCWPRWLDDRSGGLQDFILPAIPALASSMCPVMVGAGTVPIAFAAPSNSSDSETSKDGSATLGAAALGTAAIVQSNGVYTVAPVVVAPPDNPLLWCHQRRRFHNGCPCSARQQRIVLLHDHGLRRLAGIIASDKTNSFLLRKGFCVDST